ncbi:MAG: hypothetical protein AB3N28_07170 [Kordiimonas sp.]
MQLAYYLPKPLKDQLSEFEILQPEHLEAFWKSHAKLVRLGFSNEDAGVLLVSLSVVDSYKAELPSLKNRRDHFKEIRRFEGHALSAPLRARIAQVYSSQYLDLYINLLFLYAKAFTNKSLVDGELGGAFEPFIGVVAVLGVTTSDTHGPEVTRRRAIQDRLRRLEASYPSANLQEASQGVFSGLKRLFSDRVRLLLASQKT